MRGSGRNTLIRSWDYFYNSGGWDDYPPQLYIHAHKLHDAAPAVGSSHVIRAAKILRGTAAELGIEDDIGMYNADIAMLEGLLQKESWDEAAGVFSYVRHDAGDRPCGILRHESGANFNLGLDGAAPLLAGICTPEQKEALWRRLESPDHCWTPCGISTVDRSAPYYRQDGYWNGSIWMPHQWFFWKAALDDGRADFAWADRPGPRSPYTSARRPNHAAATSTSQSRPGAAEAGTIFRRFRARCWPGSERISCRGG